MENTETSRTRRQPNFSEPAKCPQPLLLLSLALNLGLLLFLALAWRRATPQAVLRPDNTIQANRLKTPARRALRTAHASPWSQLESTDLEIYAANLRNVGCPTKTVRDILLPLIEEQFDPAELPVAEPTNFWASFSERQAAAAARVEQENALEKTKEKMLKELFGFSWTSEGLTQAYAEEAAGAIGFLDYEHAEKLLCIADRYKNQFSRADRSHHIDRRLAIYQTLRQEAGEVLSPTELDETELRGILTICEYRNPNVCQAGLTGSELRQLMTYRRELCNPLASALQSRDSELGQEKDWASEQKFDAKARSLLGDSRFLNYLKSCDASIEKALATLEKEHLPRSLALQLFDLRQEAMARAQGIRQLPVRRSEKRTRLAALRQNALEELATLPNATTENPVLEINRDWLQEIANP
jgi:hypothetical protein